jgi:Uncharacterized protein conserved in bacteria (DUF2066)
VETGVGRLKIAGLKWSQLWRAGVWALLAILWSASGAPAGGPVETSIYAVQGVDVDVTSTDAAAAKNQALMDVQVKAFFQLVERLGSPELATDLQAKMKPDDIAPYLRSLSIEQETSAPGRYIGKFTVRFLPAKMQKFFDGYGVKLPASQAEPILILPVWRGADANRLWEDNPWRKAWLDFKGEQGLVPLIVPLGDLEDTETLSVDNALLNDPIKIEAIRRRYDAPSILVAQAQPAEGGIHVYIEGETRLGKVTFNKIYKADDGQIESAATAAIVKFQAALVEKYKESQAKIAAAAAAEEAAKNSNKPHSMAVAVPFASPREWNAIRSRILNAPNVTGFDLSTLSADGAVIRLMYTNSLPVLQGNMERVGLKLSQLGTTWVIQPM